MPTAQELRDQAAALLARSIELDTPLTDTDVDKLFKERRYDEIEQARKDGRLNRLLNLPIETKEN